MADRYWIASSSGNYDDTANWSTTSGGSGGSSEPTASDDVYFDANGSGNCDFNGSDRYAASIDLTGYTGTINISRYRLWRVQGGLTPGTTATVQQNGGTLTEQNNGFEFSAPASGKTVDFGTGIVDSSIYSFRVKATETDKHLLLKGNMPDAIFKLTVPVATRGWKLGGDFVVKDFDASGVGATSSFMNLDNNNLTIRGDVIPSAGFYWSTPGTGTITLSGGNADIDFNSMSVEAIEVDSTGTKTLTDAVDTKAMLVTAGTLDVNAQALETVGNFTVAAGASVIE